MFVCLSSDHLFRIWMVSWLSFFLAQQQFPFVIYSFFLNKNRMMQKLWSTQANKPKE